MHEIKTYEIDCENEGEVFEDFPNATELQMIEYDPRTMLNTFRFKIRVPVHKETIVQKYGR